MKESGRPKNQIIRWLDIHFPEYTVVFKTKKLFTARSLATLHTYPSPRNLRDLAPEQLISIWKDHMSRPGGKTGMKKASQLIRLAKTSIGDTARLNEDKRQLQYFLDAYARVRKTIDDFDDIDEEIERILPEVPCSDLVLSIGGTPSSTGVILALAGDLRQLKHGNQLLRKAGLNIAERSSGKYKGKVKRMTKMQSIMKLIGKLARMIVAMVRDAQPFVEEKILDTAAYT